VRLLLSMLIIVPLLTVSVAYGQEGDTAEAAAPEPIDEITVTAPRSLRVVRTAMVNAQDETFAVFNDLIDDPDFHITCRVERPFKDGFDPIPVHRATRVCSTRYYRRESRRATEDFLDGIEQVQVFDAAAHKEDLNQKINDLITENPEFRQAMTRFVVSKREYDEAKEKEMSTRIFSRLFGSKNEDP